jgi:signal transduction histidine kinase
VRKARSWSITRRLTGRLLIATLVSTLLTGLIVALHYGSDPDDLRQRKVLELAERLAAHAAQGFPVAEAADADIFADYPEAYRWGLYSSEGDMMAASAGGEPASASAIAWPPPSEWTSHSDVAGWAAGVELALTDGASGYMVVEARSDPAGLLVRLIAGEVLVHVVLPLAPFALLVSLLGQSIVRRTLKPVRSAAQQARAITIMEDAKALNVSHAPREVEDLITALNGAIKRVRDASNREREFVLDAAHALRTPLAALKARLEISGSHSLGAALVEDIDELTRLAGQLLASAAAERLAVAPNSRVDLGAVTRSIAADMVPFALESGIEIEADTPSGSIIVVADPDAVAHALRNLVDNAIKVSPSNGVVRLVVDSNRRVSVMDQGPGVDPARRSEIVKRFSRRTYGDGLGAGLGLSIVSRIMKAHGGGLVIDDAPSGGAVFSLVFLKPE